MGQPGRKKIKKMDGAAAFESKKRSGESSVDQKFKKRIFAPGRKLRQTEEQAREEIREHIRLRTLKIKEYRAKNPLPRNKSSRSTYSFVPAKVVFNYFPKELLPPPVPVPRPGFLARANELNKDLGGLSIDEENHNITKASAILQA